MPTDALRHWTSNYALALVGLAIVFYLNRAKLITRPWALAAVISSLVLTPALYLSRILDANAAVVAQTAYAGFLLCLMSAALWALFRPPRGHDPSRRRLLAMAAPAVAAAPMLLGGAAVASARAPARLKRVEVPVRDLAPGLHGLRIVQLSDVHFGPFFGRADLERAIGLANETKAHIAVVTGDLITYRGDDIETPLRMLARLKAEAGVFACHGNHEVHSGAIPVADDLSARLGIRVLRGEAETLRFDGAPLQLCGLDYVPFGIPVPEETEELKAADAFNVLLTHNPAGFPEVRQMGFDLMLAGHTHGGQLNLEIAQHNLNIAKIFTPYVRGLYTEEGRSIFVNSGLGTVWAPIRLGAPPEVALVTLCAV